VLPLPRPTTNLRLKPQLPTIRQWPVEGRKRLLMRAQPIPYQRGNAGARPWLRWGVARVRSTNLQAAARLCLLHGKLPLGCSCAADGGDKWRETTLRKSANSNDRATAALPLPSLLPTASYLSVLNSSLEEHWSTQCR